MKYALALISIILLGLYINTAPPVMYFGDDGEVISAAYTLGIGHPPGYPLYMLYTKLSSFLPLGDIAYRANIASGLLAVMVFLFFYLASKQALALIFGEKNIGTKCASLLAALTYCVSSIFWFEAIHSKGAIYLLMHLFVVLAVLFGLLYYRTKKLKFFYAFFFVAGFLIPAHNTSAMFLLFSAAAVIYASWKKAGARNYAFAALFFFLAFLTPYLYLFIRMKAAPAVNWGNLETYREVLGHIMRETYNYNTVNKTEIAAMLERFGDYFLAYFSNYWLFAAVSAAGAFFVLKKSVKFFTAAAAFYLLNLTALLYVINTSAGFMINDLSPMTFYTSKNFYPANDILPCMAGAAGLYGLIRFIHRKTGISMGFVFSLACLMTLIMAFSNYEKNNKSSEFLAYDHADNILKSVPEGSILFAGNDTPLFNIVYMLSVKGKYSGLEVYDYGGCLLDYSLYKGMKRKWDREEFRQIEESVVSGNYGRVYETTSKDFTDAGQRTNLHGIIYKAGFAKDESYETSKIFSVYSLRGVVKKPSEDILYRSIAASYPVMLASYEALKGDRAKAEKYLKLAAVYGRGSPGVYMNIALVYNLGLKEPQSAVPYIEQVVADNPYDFQAMNILVRTYMNFDAENALRWMTILYGRLANDAAKKEAAMRIQALQAEILQAKRQQEKIQ